MSDRGNSTSPQPSAKASGFGRLLESWSSGILIVVLLLLWADGRALF